MIDMSKTSSTFPDFMNSGWEAEIGFHTFTDDEIVEYANAYDPQIFHVDKKAAEQSLFGGLCASGWHTASMWMRKQREFMTVQMADRQAQNLPLPEVGPSPGFTNLRWHKPVYAGDTITYFNSTVSSRESKSKPNWFIISGYQSAKNQDGELVLSFESSVFMKYRA